MTGSSRASARSRFRRPAFRSASRGCSRRCARSRARSSPRRRRPAPSSCSRSTATRTRWRTISGSSRACARRAIAAELYLGSGGMNAQLKYADRRRSRVAVIQGSNERNAAGGPQVTIRDLKLGAELAKSTKDRADYLELRQRAQFSRARGGAGRAGARGSRAALGRCVYTFYCCVANSQPRSRSIIWIVLAPSRLAAKTPVEEGLDFLGFPWILSSESRDINQLHAISARNFFASLSPRSTRRGLAPGIETLRIAKDRP